jgi:Zn-dependent peptidase ImmA (M78 family)
VTTCDLHALAERDQPVELDDLEAIARFFSRPWPYLLIDEPEAPPAVGRDHRRRPGGITSLSDELLEALRLSDEQLATIIDLFPDEFIQTVDADIGSGSVETAGTALRRFLNVTIDQQVSAREEFRALRIWIDALDARGIYVAQRKFNDTSVRAFSLYRDAHALAVLDTGDSASARSFSLLHEFVHLQMRSDGLCDLDERSSIERWCNAVAAATLMPPALLQRPDMNLLRGRPEVADDALRAKAKEVGVSQLALLIRCRDLGLVNEEQYEGLFLRWSHRWSSTTPTSRGGDFYVNAVNRVGRRYARHVLGALGEDVITRQDAAAALDVREHQLNRLARQL